MVQSEFHKIVRNNENIARKLLIKIENCEKNRNAIIRKS